MYSNLLIGNLYFSIAITSAKVWGAEGSSRVLGGDFVLPIGSQVQVDKTQSPQIFKSVGEQSEVEVNSFYQIKEINFAPEMDPLELVPFQRSAQKGLLYLSAEIIRPLLDSSPSPSSRRFKNITLDRPAVLYRSHEAIDSNPSDPAVRPKFFGVDNEDQMILSKEFVGTVGRVNQQGRQPEKCVVSMHPNVPPPAVNAALNCYRQNSSMFRKPWIVIMDLTQPSTQKRFHVIDARTGEIIRSEFAMHGKGISSKDGSNGTPSGFHRLDRKLYRNGKPYKIGIELKGLESRNKNSHGRNIRLHNWGDADAMEEGYQNPTWGCVGLPDDVMEDLFDDLSDGSLLFNYSGSQEDLRMQTGTCKLTSFDK